MKTFNETFKELAKRHDASVLFNDFLDYSIDQFLINPDKKYFNYKNYNKDEYKSFYTLFEAWIQATQEGLESYPWYDALGLIYEEHIQSAFKKKGNAQFFTPDGVTECMSRLVNTDTVVDGVGYCYDATCGSGRLLLAHHSRRLFDVCIGHDLDMTSCKMTVLNFLLHGVKGGVVCCNSLTGEFFNAWKVNEFIDLGQYSVMEVDSRLASEVFIGVYRPRDVDTVTIHEDKGIVNDEPSGQTSLGEFI